MIMWRASITTKEFFEVIHSLIGLNGNYQIEDLICNSLVECVFNDIRSDKIQSSLAENINAVIADFVKKTGLAIDQVKHKSYMQNPH